MVSTMVLQDLQYYKYTIMTLDPVHIGTGGYRLGRVDNTIVREPGTNLPKIPGSSLHGAIRSAAAVRYGEPEARGQRPKGNRKHSCIVYTFGAGTSAEGTTEKATSETGQFSSGVVSIHDAQIVLFPIASHTGPIWITTAGILSEAGFKKFQQPTSRNKVVISDSIKPLGKNTFAVGWLMLAAEDHRHQLTWSNEYRFNDSNESILAEALKRTVIVHEDIFGHLVNSGLEVRTSVAIDPQTGTAVDGGLFTYEALPRATFLDFEVIVDDFYNEFPEPKVPNVRKGPNGVVFEGLNLLEYLGVGGMNTRGFGRIKNVGHITNNPYKE